MNTLRFAVAFAGVALTLIGVVTGLTLSSYAAILFAIFVAMNWALLNRIAQVFAALCFVATFYVLVSDVAPIDVTAGAFLFAFLTVSGSLRIAAANEPAIVSFGKRLTLIPTNRQFVLVSLSTGLFALVLLNGALNFVSGIFSAKVNAPLAERMRLIRTCLSGFSLNPILSPMAIPFLVISSMLPAISWSSMLPYLAVCGGLVWISGRIQNAFLGSDDRPETLSADKTNPDVEDAADDQRVTALALIFAPIVTALALIAFGDFKPSHAAFTSVFLASLIWPGLRLKKPGLVVNGHTVAINEATILGSSLVLGTLLIQYLPPDWEQASAAVLFGAGPFAPAVIIIFFAVSGLLGLQPTFSFLLSYAAVFPFVSAMGEAGAPIYAALIVGWSLNSLVSPFGLPVLIVSNAFNIGAADVVLKHGYVFLALSVLSTSIALMLFRF